MKKLLTLLSVCSLKLWAGDYAFINLDYGRAVQRKAPWHIASDARVVGSAEFKHKDSSLHYTDAHASLYYSHFLAPHHALSWEIGYSYTHLGWEKNPRFHQQDFNELLASLAWVSDALEGWRWTFQAATSVNADTINFSNSGVYSALAWGRYCYSKHIGLHIGMAGFTGVKQTYTFPIIGFDAHYANWLLQAIFPLDFSLKYSFTSNWFTSLVYDTFGGPYRFPRRVEGGHGKYHDAIFEIHSTGVSWDFGYESGKRIWASIGAGWNFGGWILIKNARGHHGKYYKYDSAPYGLAKLALSF